MSLGAAGHSEIEARFGTATGFQISAGNAAALAVREPMLPRALMARGVAANKTGCWGTLALSPPPMGAAFALLGAVQQRELQ